MLLFCDTYEKEIEIMAQIFYGGENEMGSGFMFAVCFEMIIIISVVVVHRGCFPDWFDI